MSTIEAALAEWREVSKSLGGGPFIGPRGGKYADAAHTQPWQEPGAPKSKKGTHAARAQRAVEGASAAYQRAVASGVKGPAMDDAKVALRNAAWAAGRVGAGRGAGRRLGTVTEWCSTALRHIATATGRAATSEQGVP